MNRNVEIELCSAAGPDMLTSSDEKTKPNVQPDDYELSHLFRHWAQRVIEAEWRDRADRSRGSGPPYAYERMAAMKKAIGEEQCNELFAEEMALAGQNRDFEEWRNFWYGTEDERAAYRERMCEPPKDGDPIFAVPMEWRSWKIALMPGKRIEWEGRKCDLHNRLTGRMMVCVLNADSQSPENAERKPYCFRLKYGPWECPDCHAQVYYAFGRYQCYKDDRFDPQATAALLAEVCPPRKRPA